MNTRRLIVTTAAGCAAALALALLPATAGAAPAAPADDAVLVHEVEVVSGDAGARAGELAASGFDVIARSGDRVYVLGPASTGDDLADAAGLAVVGSQPAVPLGPDAKPPASQDAILPDRLDGREYETFYGGYRTVDAYVEYEDDLAAAYPDLVQVIDYGESWEGDALRAVCITADADKNCKLDPKTKRPRFLVVAQTHARELTTSELTWRFMTELVDGYGKDARVTGLLGGTEVWLVPHVNPDGIRVVQDGITEQGTGSSSPAWQRKNTNDTYSDPACSGTWASSQEGVDINRNFDVDWGRTGTSKVPCNLTYGGPEADSEPETTAQEELMQALYRDRRDPGMEAPAPKGTKGGMLTLHSYANQVLLPWGFTTQHAPNEVGLRSYAFRMSWWNGFEAGQSGEILYNSSGATEDWLYAELGVAGFTWEVGPGGSCGGFFPPYSCQDGFWDQNGEALLFSAEAARKPYKEPLGPTTYDAKAKAGKKIKLTATSNDAAYGASGVGRPAAQDVTAGRVYVGKAPWTKGAKAQAMTVVGSGSEVTLRAKIKKPAKKTLAYVQGKDAQGNWGPVTAVWLKP